MSEVALAVVLLIGAALMLKSFSRLTHPAPVFARTMRSPPKSRSLQRNTTPRTKQREFFSDVLSRVQSLPGVQSAALMTVPLLADYLSMTPYFRRRSTRQRLTLRSLFRNAMVSPDYFQAAGIPLLAGRAFGENDTKNSPSVVIVNETLARRYWPARQAVGKRLSRETDKDAQPLWLEIVAVAGDTRDVSLTTLPKAEIYLPSSQAASTSMNILVRAKADTTALEPALRDAVWSVDRDQPVQSMATLDQAVAHSEAEPKFHTLLLGIFAALGLAITLVGIYGVISYSVSQRTREIGIRMALGARSRDVLRQVLWEGMKLALLGLAIGIIAALALTRVLTSLLFEVRATDPATFAVISSLLACVALAACYLPARRATKVDPLVALRYE